MRGSFRLGRVCGIEIRVHAVFFLVPLYAALRGGERGWAGAAWAAFYTFAAFACVVLHELGHSLVAQRLGVGVRDITLLPIGGVARLAGMPRRPAAELKIAVAGPLVNLGLAALLLPLLFIGIAAAPLTGERWISTAADVLAGLVAINVLMAAFNALPAFPMDGGRILRAGLATLRPYAAATRAAVRVGRVLALLMFAAGVLLGHVGLALIAVFVLLAGAHEQEMALRYAAGSAADADPRPGGVVVERPLDVSAGTARLLPEEEAARAFADLARRLEAIRTGRPPAF